MNFLIDAQLPQKLSELLSSLGENSIYTLELPEGNRTTDEMIRALSVTENRTIITKDTDFLDSHILNGLPQKLIIVTTGNIMNQSSWTFLKIIGMP